MRTTARIAWHTSVLAPVLALAALGGCATTTDPAPTVSLGTASSSATPTMPAPVPSPAKPAQWSDNGVAGASAAAVWFLSDEYRYIVETNDVTDWKALSHGDCQFCTSTEQWAAQARENGYVGRTDPIIVTVTRVEELNPLAYSVVVRYEQPAVRNYTTSGVPRNADSAESGQVLLVLHREGPDWQLREGQYFSSDAPVPTASDAS